MAKKNARTVYCDKCDYTITPSTKTNTKGQKCPRCKKGTMKEVK